LVIQQDGYTKMEPGTTTIYINGPGYESSNLHVYKQFTLGTNGLEDKYARVRTA